MSQKAILITGGAGHVGSQVLLQLQARGERVVALVPINPYGTSKLMSEWILRDLAAVSDFR